MILEKKQFYYLSLSISEQFLYGWRTGEIKNSDYKLELIKNFSKVKLSLEEDEFFYSMLKIKYKDWL